MIKRNLRPAATLSAPQAVNTEQQSGDITGARGWRVFRDGADLGVAFTLEGASEAVDSLRRGFWHPRAMPSFYYRPDTVSGAVPFRRCVLGQ